MNLYGFELSKLPLTERDSMIACYNNWRAERDDGFTLYFPTLAEAEKVLIQLDNPPGLMRGATDRDWSRWG